ncbi:hypothetical protein [Ornithinimicrobium sp. Y1694]|uniref:hypothetical protein n=1 Tax=Ornithinimicrobium sp. Y1694 TaxID=3418590 RepID=UPI003CF1FFA2
MARKLSPEGREAWTTKLVELGVGAGGDDHEAARGVVANLEGMDEEGRTAFADAVTPEIAEIIGHSHPAFAAFEGFPHSPEAEEVGEEDDHPANRDDSHAGEDTREGPVPGAPA